MGSSVKVSGSLGSIGPVSLDPIVVDGIPSDFSIDVKSLPKISIGVDPVTLNPVTLNPVEATITLRPLDMNISVKELPERRTHLPADFTVGLSVLGMQLLCVRLCGEAQMVSENFHPNPCEVCGEVGRHPSHG